MKKKVESKWFFSLYSVVNKLPVGKIRDAFNLNCQHFFFIHLYWAHKKDRLSAVSAQNLQQSPAAANCLSVPFIILYTKCKTVKAATVRESQNRTKKISDTGWSHFENWPTLLFRSTAITRKWNERDERRKKILHMKSTRLYDSSYCYDFFLSCQDWTKQIRWKINITRFNTDKLISQGFLDITSSEKKKKHSHSVDFFFKSMGNMMRCE